MTRWVRVFMLVAMAGPVLGQSFEVATLKVSPPPEGDLININLGNLRNGRLTFGNASLSDCLKFAYGISADAQIAGPEWIKSKAVRFDIVAQAPAGTPEAQINLMLQGLLRERLGVALHHEAREMSYLALVVGKDRAKVQEVTPDPAGSKNSKAMRGRIVSEQITMARLAMLLSRFERQTVFDQTGLSGSYQLKLEWTPEEATPAAPENGPSLFTAVQEQLGLRLVARKGPVDVLVIDHAEQKPAEN